MGCIFRARIIQERGMRSQHCPVRVGIVALDQEYLLGRLIRQEVPLVLGVMLDAVRLSLEMRVNEAVDDEIFVWIHGAPVSDCQRVVRYWILNGTPDVDQAHAGLEETVGLGGEMVLHPSDAGMVRLVDVHAFLQTRYSIRYSSVR